MQYSACRHFAIFFALGLLACQHDQEPETTALMQGLEGCLIDACHGRVEQIHYGGVALTCVDCHGGDPDAITKEAAHPTISVSFNSSTPGTQGPGGQVLAGISLAELDAVDRATLQFLNPADYRVAPQTCGSSTRGGGNCHTRITGNSILSTHATLSGQLAGGLYFAGLTDRDARYGVRELVDEHPSELVGYVDSLALFPGDAGDLTPSGEAASGYFVNLSQLCIDCHLSQDGALVPGKYTSSGCNACHMLTEDDGRPLTTDPTQEPDELGHGALHRYTNLIPDSQCNRCHHAHLQRGLLAQGVRERSEPEGDEGMGGHNRGVEDSEDAVFWPQANYVRFQGGYNLYGKPYPFYISDEDGTNDVDETPPDIHTERGMACIDCHTTAELHGRDHLAERREFETTVRCESCHGTPADPIVIDITLPFVQSLSRVGGNAANPAMFTENDDGDLQQLGKFDRVQHPLTQISERLDPEEARFNPRVLMGCGLHAGDEEFRAMLGEWYASTDPSEVDEVFPGMPEGASLAADFGMRSGRLECFSCHNTWTVNCYGCHVLRDDQLTYTDQVTGQVEAGRMSTFAMSVVPDALALGFNSRSRISPMVGTSIFFTHVDSMGEVIVDAAPLLTVDGFSGDGNQHNPVHHHTVRRQPRDCQGCHPRADGTADDVDALARAIGFGTNTFLFIDGEGREHLLDRLVALDFDGDGVWDDPTTTSVLDGPAVAAEQIAASTHLPLYEDMPGPGPGPLDLDTINRILLNPVVPQRPDE